MSFCLGLGPAWGYAPLSDAIQRSRQAYAGVIDQKFPVKNPARKLVDWMWQYRSVSAGEVLNPLMHRVPDSPFFRVYQTYMVPPALYTVYELPEYRTRVQAAVTYAQKVAEEGATPQLKNHFASLITQLEAQQILALFPSLKPVQELSRQQQAVFEDIYRKFSPPDVTGPPKPVEALAQDPAFWIASPKARLDRFITVYLGMQAESLTPLSGPESPSAETAARYAFWRAFLERYARYLRDNKLMDPVLTGWKSDTPIWTQKVPLTWIFHHFYAHSIQKISALQIQHSVYTRQLRQEIAGVHLYFLQGPLFSEQAAPVVQTADHTLSAWVTGLSQVPDGVLFTQNSFDWDIPFFKTLSPYYADSFSYPRVYFGLIHRLNDFLLPFSYFAAFRASGSSFDVPSGSASQQIKTQLAQDTALALRQIDGTSRQLAAIRSQLSGLSPAAPNRKEWVAAQWIYTERLAILRDCLARIKALHAQADAYETQVSRLTPLTQPLRDQLHEIKRFFVQIDSTSQVDVSKERWIAMSTHLISAAGQAYELEKIPFNFDARYSYAVSHEFEFIATRYDYWFYRDLAAFIKSNASQFENLDSQFPLLVSASSDLMNSPQRQAEIKLSKELLRYIDTYQANLQRRVQAYILHQPYWFSYTWKTSYFGALDALERARNRLTRYTEAGSAF